MYPDKQNVHPLCVCCIIAFKWSRRADSQNHKPSAQAEAVSDRQPFSHCLKKFTDISWTQAIFLKNKKQKSKIAKKKNTGKMDFAQHGTLKKNNSAHRFKNWWTEKREERKKKRGHSYLLLGCLV